MSGRRTYLRLEALTARDVPASLFADFNGDGFDDLAVGMPDADDSEAPNAGVVLVTYGFVGGFRTDTAVLITQDGLGIDASETGDRFGATLAAGDFNGDGRDDLVVGAGGEDDAAGAVYVLYGSAGGPGATVAVRWDQDSPDVQGGKEAGDRFGAALAVGDFDGDGKDDLAVGAYGEKLVLSSVGDNGVVHVFRGSLFGLLAAGNQLWSQSSANIPGATQPEDRFGFALAAGDFNGDGKADLAVGVPGDRLGAKYAAGTVHVLYGSPAGLSAAKNQRWSQDSAGIAGGAESRDRFGTALAAGDFDGNGRDDLAIGVPDETVGSVDRAGAVHVVYGTANRLSALRSQMWTGETAGWINRTNECFGLTLAAGDFDGNGRDDLVVGTSSAITVGGRVVLLTGLSTRLAAFGQSWSLANMTGQPLQDPHNGFGRALAVGDYNGDGRADLAIGVPGLKVNGVANAGAVRVMFGGTDRLSAGRTGSWSAADFGLSLAAGDEFGSAL